MIGIYKFTSKITGQSYIGQSIKIEHRYKEHLNNIKNFQENSKWYQALREQGIENFEFSILEECQPEELNEREIYWIQYYDSYNNGYNSTPGGQTKYCNPQLIYEAWDEGLAPLEIAQKLNIGTTCVYNNLIGYKNYNKHEAKVRGGQLANKKRKNNLSLIKQKLNNVYQYDLEGNFIKEWSSCKAIQRELGYDPSYIGKCINGKRLSAYGYQWNSQKLDKIPSKIKTNGIPRKVIQLDLENNIICIHSSLKEAAKAVNGNDSFISKVCKNDNIAYGYKWKYFE